MRFRLILETRHRKRNQMKSLMYQRRRMNCRMGMLTKTYQKPADVRCQHPPGSAYQVEVSTGTRMCQSHRPIVYTKIKRLTSAGTEFRSLTAAWIDLSKR